MNEFLAKLPSTNARILVTLILYALTVTNVNLCMFFGKTLDIQALVAVFVLLTAMAGVDYYQFSKKRDTYQASPPSPPDIEDSEADPLTSEANNATQATAHRRPKRNAGRAADRKGKVRHS